MPRIVHANIYAHNRRLALDLAKLRDLKPLILGINEGYNAVGPLSNMRNYTAHTNKKRGRGQQDCVTLVPQHVHFLWARSIQMTRMVQPFRIAPARFMQVVAFTHKDRYGDTRKRLHANVHCNAVLQDKKTGGPLLRAARVQEHLKMMKKMEELLRGWRAQDFEITISGDFNWRNFPHADDDTEWYWSPHQMFKRLGLDYWAVGLDYIAWPKGYEVEAKEIIPADETGSDHPWLVIDLDPKKKK